MNQQHTVQRVLDALTALLDASIDTADRDQLAAITGWNATVKAHSASVDLRVARRANELKAGGESEGGFEMVFSPPDHQQPAA